MCELVLLELGWRARFLGTQLPCETLESAIEDMKPDMLWLSVSSVGDSEAFIEANARLYSMCMKNHCAMVAGGSALTDELRPRILLVTVMFCVRQTLQQ